MPLVEKAWSHTQVPYLYTSLFGPHFRRLAGCFPKIRVGKPDAFQTEGSVCLLLSCLQWLPHQTAACYCNVWHCLHVVAVRISIRSYIKTLASCQLSKTETHGNTRVILGKTRQQTHRKMIRANIAKLRKISQQTGETFHLF